MHINQEISKTLSKMVLTWHTLESSYYSLSIILRVKLCLLRKWWIDNQSKHQCPGLTHCEIKYLSICWAFTVLMLHCSVTNYHRLRDLKQYIFIISQFHQSRVYVRGPHCLKCCIDYSHQTVERKQIGMRYSVKLRMCWWLQPLLIDIFLSNKEHICLGSSVQLSSKTLDCNGIGNNIMEVWSYTTLN